ncbi:MAG: hypothetical protein H7A46_25275, partial [Verrucomicrobiales bacterium]|nr:hypothetical protein [Verrucomicrobiales bacterium]
MLDETSNYSIGVFALIQPDRSSITEVPQGTPEPSNGLMTPLRPKLHPKRRRPRTCPAFAWLVTLTLLSTPPILAEEGGAGHYLSGATASFIDAFSGRTALAVVPSFVS